mgnify:CR=1 FL=1
MVSATCKTRPPPEWNNFLRDLCLIFISFDYDLTAGRIEFNKVKPKTLLDNNLLDYNLLDYEPSLISQVMGSCVF